MTPISRVSCPSSAPCRAPVEPFTLPGKEGVMFEWNFSSNADWLVALLLAVTVVGALL